MRAVLTAVIAAIEAVAVALAGLAIVAVPALLMWWLTFSLSAEVDDLFATIAGIWLLAHFVPLGFEVTAESALGFGLAPEPFAFTLSLAPLGLTLLTVALAFRSGWRFAERGGTGAGGVAGGTVGFAVAAALVVVLGAPLSPWPMWLAVLVPALCYGVAAGSGFVLRAALLGHGWWRSLMRGLLRRLEWTGALRVAALPGRAAETVRIAAGSFTALIGLAALGVTIALVVGYIEIITLSQGLQLDPLGLIALFLLNLALLPVALVWAIAWFTGGGFAIGAGTSVTPFETLLGPLPVFPLFGAVPQGWGWAGGLAPALIVLLGVTVGVLAGARPGMRRNSITACLVIPFIAAALVGLAVAGLAALATGSIGPDRLAVTGPQPWLTGGLAAALLFVGLALGVLARRLDVANRLLDATKAGYAQPSEASPVDPAADPAAETREIVPFERVRPEPAAQAETVELEPAPREHVDPVPVSDPVPGPDADPTPRPAPEQTSAQNTEPEQDPEPAQDPLLEAFSWKNSPEHERGEPGDGAAGWRPPWRKR